MLSEAIKIYIMCAMKILRHIIIFCCVMLGACIVRSEDMLEPRLELGFSLGGLNANEKQSYLLESSFLYPEVGAWVNLGDKARFGATAGFIYMENATIGKTISILPVMLEMNILQMEQGDDYQQLFMELGLGLGFFVSVADIYQNANAWSLKIGAGMVSEDLIFSISAKVIGCTAKSKGTFSYFDGGSIGDEMDLGGVSIAIGVGSRY